MLTVYKALRWVLGGKADGERRDKRKGETVWERDGVWEAWRRQSQGRWPETKKERGMERWKEKEEAETHRKSEAEGAEKKRGTGDIKREEKKR